jgi:hypothetical protein
MANVKISDLPAAVAAQIAMQFEVNDNGTSRRVTGGQLDNLILGTTNGFVARTGANARAARTITAGSGIAVTNGNGASGNPAIALSTAAQQSLAAADAALPASAIATLAQAQAGEGNGWMSAELTAAAIDALADAGVEISETAPANPEAGALWLKPSDGTLRIYQQGGIVDNYGTRASVFNQTGWTDPANAVDGSFLGDPNRDGTFAVWTSATSNATNTSHLENFKYAYVSLADRIPTDAVITEVTLRIKQHVSNTARMLGPQVRAFVGTTAVGSGPVTLALTTDANNTDIVTLTGITAANLRDPNFRVQFVARKANNTQSATQALAFLDVIVGYTVEVEDWQPVIHKNAAGNVGIGKPAHPNYVMDIRRERFSPEINGPLGFGTLRISEGPLWEGADGNYQGNMPAIMAGRLDGTDVALISVYTERHTLGTFPPYAEINYGGGGDAPDGGVDDLYKAVNGHLFLTSRPDGHGQRNVGWIDRSGFHRFAMPGNPGLADDVNTNLLNSAGTSLRLAAFCRGFANFNGVSGQVGLRSAFNVSSVERQSIGVYRVNFAEHMPNTNYSAQANAEIGGIVGSASSVYVYATDHIILETFNTDGVQRDAFFISIAIFG